jgi:phospholipid/cholesterol/gamma-HCH transport system substrate-binding protein
MASKAQKIRVGLFALASAGLLAVVLIIFGGVKFWAKTDRYRIELDDSAYGLEEGAKVYFNGIRVGSVVDIAFANDPRLVDIEISIEEGTPVRSDTRAMLRLAGITGLKEIDLRGGSSDAPRLEPGDSIQAGETTLDILEARATEIADRSIKVMERAEKLVDNLVQLSDPKDYEALRASARRTADNLAEASGALNQMIDENRLALRGSVDAIHKTAKNASKVFDLAGVVVAQVDGVVRDNQGSLRAAITDLRQASRSLKDMAREVRQRPSRLLFGKPAGDRKLP